MSNYTQATPAAKTTSSKVRILRMKQLLDKIPFTASHIYGLIKEEKFPKPFHLILRTTIQMIIDIMKTKFTTYQTMFRYPKTQSRPPRIVLVPQLHLRPKLHQTPRFPIRLTPFLTTWSIHHPILPLLLAHLDLPNQLEPVHLNLLQHAHSEMQANHLASGLKQET